MGIRSQSYHFLENFRANNLSIWTAHIRTESVIGPRDDSSLAFSTFRTDESRVYGRAEMMQGVCISCNRFFFLS